MLRGSLQARRGGAAAAASLSRAWGAAPCAPARRCVGTLGTAALQHDDCGGVLRFAPAGPSTPHRGRSAAQLASRVAATSAPSAPAWRATQVRRRHDPGAGLKYDYKPKWRPQRTDLGPHEDLPARPRDTHTSGSGIVVHDNAGVRVLRLNRRDAVNQLDTKTVKRLVKMLREWEDNDAVSIVLLHGFEGEAFCTGEDIAFLHKRAQDPAHRAKVLDFFRAMHTLQHLVATYTKPVVANMSHEGVAGAGTALALNSTWAFSTETSSVSVPYTSMGLAPMGGLSHRLAHMGGGVGMYLALTGQPLSGDTLFWAGVSSHHSNSKYLEMGLADTFARVTDTSMVDTSIEEDPAYKANLKFLRENRGEAAFDFLRVETELSSMEVTGYYRVKQWWRHMLVGDREAAQHELESTHTPSQEDVGLLLDIRAGPEVEGFSRPVEPMHPVTRRRLELAADAMFYLEAQEPSPEQQEMLAAIERCFGGDVARGDPLRPARKQGPAADAAAGAASETPELERDLGFLDPDWAQTIAVPRARRSDAVGTAALEEVASDAFIDAGRVPTPEDVASAAEAVRRGVDAMWPSGSLNLTQLRDICYDCNVPEGSFHSDVVETALLRVVSLLSGVPVAALAGPTNLTGGARSRLRDEKAASAAAGAGAGGDDDVDSDAELLELEEDVFELMNEGLKPKPLTPSVNMRNLSINGGDGEAELAAQEARDAAEKEDQRHGPPLHRLGSHDDDPLGTLEQYTPDDEHVELALNDPDELLKMYGLPRTRRLRQVARRTADRFKAERLEEQWAPTQVASVEAVMERLKAEGTEWADQTLATLQARSPLALKLAHRLLVEASSLSLEESMALEYRAAARALEAGDFATWAAANDASSAAAADGKPAWVPSALEALADSDVDALLAPLASEEAELALPTAERAERWAPIEAEMERWFTELERWYESGEGMGTGADEIRKRFMWFV